VTSAPQVSSVVSARYATALIDLAEDSKLLDKVEKDLHDLEAMIAASGDLTRVIRSPLTGRSQQAAAMDALASKARFQKLTVNFLGVLVQNRRLYALESILRAARREFSRRRGEVKAHVETAEALNTKQKDTLQRSISNALGTGISLETSVNPAILGGVIVTIGSRMIDDSVRRKLARLRSAMSRQANQNITQNIEEVG